MRLFDPAEARRALLLHRLAARRGAAGGPVPLPRGEYPRRLPSSLGQARLWFLDQLAPGLTAYNETITIRLRGALEEDRLRAALDAVAARHETLRTSLAEHGGDVVQVVEAPGPVPLGREDLSAAEEGPMDALAAACARDAAEPFDLAHGPLLRARLYRLGGREHVLSLVLHHAVTDGWSAGVFLRDLAAAYEAVGLGLPPPGPAAIQYADFAAWQRERMEGSLRQSLVEQWQARLGDTPLRLDLPADRPRPPVQGFEAGRVVRRLPVTLALALRDLCRRRGVTPFGVLLTATQVLLHRLTGQERFLVGAPSSGRLRPELEDAVGFFINNLVFPADLSGGATVEELLARNRELAAFALSAQELPFEALVDAMRPPRDPSRTPLFQVLVNYLNIENEPRTAGHLLFEPMARPVVEAKFDLTVYGAEEPEGLRLELVYDRGLFDEARVEAMAESLGNAIVGVVADPARDLRGLALAGPRSQAVHPALGPIAAERTERIESAFVEAARARPDDVALRAAGAPIPYSALAERARRIAAALLASGAARGDVVGLCLPRSPDLVAGLLGVLEAGAAFLVLDPAHPAERNAFVLERARPRIVVGDRASLDHLAPAGAAAEALPPRIELEALLRGAGGAEPPTAGAAAGAEDLAYMAVTSGTTGRPLAVRGTHGPVVQFLQWQRATFGLEARDRFALVAGLGHDPLLRDVLAPLSVGARLSIPGEGVLRDPDAFFDWLAAEAITVLHATPGLLRLALGAAGASSRQLLSLRLVFSGGDVLRWSDVRVLRAVAPGVRVVNLYGTTETPQGVAFFDTAADPRAIDGDDGPVPVGRGRAGVELQVLDAQDRLTAIGELGEVCVRTPWLTEGYAFEPELTRRRFVTNPLGSDVGDRAYRTGDLGRYRPDGAVALAGRADRQIKRSGYRIDPAEIEAQIVAHAGVRQAAVLATGEGDAVRLAAFVVPGAPAATPAEVKAWLARRLPPPFVPADVVVLDRLPLTPNGKIDAARLPVPSADAAPPPAAAADGGGEPLADERTVRLLASLWQQHLGARPSRLEDDFFEMGGHSLAAAQFVNAVRRETGAEISLAQFIATPTLGALARHVAGRPTRFAALVRFREGVGRAPVFLVHPVAGTVLRYRPLAAYFSPRRPVFGLQSRALDPEAPVPATLAELAAHHVDDVLRVTGDGICHLAGHSLGGAIALEMAIQIGARGGRVGLVGLFDTWRPDLARVVPPMPNRVATRLANVGRLHGDERREYVREWLEGVAQRRGVPIGRRRRAKAPLLLRVRRINERAAEAYEPRPYGGAVTLFRAAVRPTDRRDRPDLGWDEYCTGGLEIVPVGGDHNSLIDEPYAEDLARLMEARMRD